ncbi:hypothetical protein BH10BAC5_BH10BAC5_15610 [soil metagenome]
MKKILLICILFITTNAFAQLDYSWFEYTSGAFANSDFPSKMICDNNGYAYVVGTVNGLPGENPNVTGENIVIKKYDRFGGSISMLYNFGDYSYDEGRDVAVDAFGNIYVLGLVSATEDVNDGYQMIVLKYNSSGSLLNSKIIYSSSMEASSITIDDNGNCYVLGRYFPPGDNPKATCIFFCLNSALDVVWSNVFTPYPIEYGSNGEIFTKNIVRKGNFLYLAYQYQYFSEFFTRLSKYDLAGNFLWEKQLESNFKPSEVGVDNNFDVYVAGSKYGFYSYPELIKYNAAGDLQFTRQIDSSGTFNDMEITSDNSIYLSGNDNNALKRIYAMKYDNAGNNLWFNSHRDNSASLSSASYLALTPGDVLVTTGNFFTDPSFFYSSFTIMFNKLTGQEEYSNHNYTTLIQKPVSIAADKYGNAFVAAKGNTNSSGDDWLVFGLHYPLHIVSRVFAATGLYPFTVSGGALDVFGTIASINVNSITGNGNVSVNFNSTEPIAPTFTGTAPLNISKYSWTILKAAEITSINAEVRFDYTQIDNAGITNPSDVKIFQRAVSGTGDFTELPTTIVGTEFRATVTSFGEFILGSASQPLPVELSSFTSTIKENSVELKWITANEVNNNGFEIERRSRAGEFVKIGFINGNGTSGIQHSYSFKDNALLADKYNYRLKQIDFNGNYKYYDLSSEVVIGVPLKYSLFQNYPNPFNPSTKISFEVPKDGFVSLKIFDITGREVSELISEIKTAGYYSVNFNATSLSSGIYFYRLTAGEFTSVKKMNLIK